MNINTKANLLVKQDRVIERIDDFYNFMLRQRSIKERGYITFEEFKDFKTSVELIVTTELNKKGAEREWKT